MWSLGPRFRGDERRKTPWLRTADRPRPASGATISRISAQRVGGGHRRGRYVIRPLEVEAGVLDDLRDAVAGMHAGEAEAAPRVVEIEQAAVGDERDRAAGAEDVRGLAPGALMKSTLGTSVRRECSVRNRITFGTT